LLSFLPLVVTLDPGTWNAQASAASPTATFRTSSSGELLPSSFVYDDHASPGAGLGGGASVQGIGRGEVAVGEQRVLNSVNSPFVGMIAGPGDVVALQTEAAWAACSADGGQGYANASFSNVGFFQI